MTDLPSVAVFFCTSEDRVLSDVDPREGVDTAHLPSSTWNGVADAKATSSCGPEACCCAAWPSRASRHAAHHAEASRCPGVARHWPARDARLVTWNAKDARHTCIGDQCE